MEEVADDGLLLESRWFKLGAGSLLVIAFGNVPNCRGISAVRSIRLLISDGTDSALRILGNVRNDIRHEGASLVHLLWHFNLQCLHLTPNIMLLQHTWHVWESQDLVENLCVIARPMSLLLVCGELLCMATLSSRVGVTGIMYGAEAGMGPGVLADCGLGTESSGLFPQPLI